jgi:hypothetical protein
MSEDASIMRPVWGTGDRFIFVTRPHLMLRFMLRVQRAILPPHERVGGSNERAAFEGAG